MLLPMWIFPLVAAGVALVFAVALLRQYLSRRRPYQLLWAIALLMYAGGSAALFLGVLGGWSAGDYRIYWLLGAVLNVPFLAAGEVYLLVKSRKVADAVLLLLIFATAFALNRIRTALIDPAALAKDLPLGREVFAKDAFSLHLAQWYSIPTWVFLLFGTLLSAWRMRRDAALRDRFFGTLWIAVGSTIAAAGAGFAAAGILWGFSLTLTAAIAVMFWGFLRASRPTPRLAAPAS